MELTAAPEIAIGGTTKGSLPGICHRQHSRLGGSALPLGKLRSGAADSPPGPRRGLVMKAIFWTISILAAALFVVGDVMNQVEALFF